MQNSSLPGSSRVRQASHKPKRTSKDGWKENSHFQTNRVFKGVCVLYIYIIYSDMNGKECLEQRSTMQPIKQQDYNLSMRSQTP